MSRPIQEAYKNRMQILPRAKGTGEGAVDASIIENLHFTFLLFYISNSMAEVSQDDKVTRGNPFSIKTLCGGLSRSHFSQWFFYFFI
jgi:hypothetical protein